ncbi:MAG: hypothetical protein IMW98_07570, partial [Firmicutes bacterium]|nr:hypothetical protein [Bacillota bacterium]
AQDVAPDTVADQEGPGALIRRYLDAGGNILWLGDIPFYYQGRAHQSLGVTAWGSQGEAAVLGLPAGAQMPSGTGQPATPTSAGQGYGIQAQNLAGQDVADTLASSRPLDPSQLPCGVEPLAMDARQDMSGWRLGFAPNRWDSLTCADPIALGQAMAKNGPGFVRVYDTGLDGADGTTESDVLAIAGQVAGWYLDQAVTINWQNPYSGPVFDQGPAGAAPWRRSDWPDQRAHWIWSFPMASANAPAGWPVRFARLFELSERTILTIRAAADDQVLHLWVDGQEQPLEGGCSWSGGCGVGVTLGAGRHLLVVEAENAPGQTRFRNPAGFLLTVQDVSGQVLFSTAADGTWTSWTAPNPDWAVYSDARYPTSWLTGGASFAQFMGLTGFRTLDANGLASWMRNEIQSGKAPQSVVVFAQDIAPDTVADQESSAALVRQYLNAGGNVLWIADVPFYYQGHSGNWSTTWGNQGLQAILGVGDDARHWGKPAIPQPTTAGMGYGIGLSPYGMRWADMVSIRPVPTYQTPTPDGMNCQLEDLATHPNGGASYWRVGYWPNGPDALGGCAGWDQYFPQAWSSDAPGFIRIYEPGGIDISRPDVEKSVLQVAAQIAGWYPGQDTALQVALGSLTFTPNPAWAGDTVQASVTASKNGDMLDSVQLDLPWSDAPVQLSPQFGGDTWAGSFQAPADPACGPTGTEAGYWALDPRTQDLSGNGNNLAQRGGGFADAGAPCGGQAFATSPATG